MPNITILLNPSVSVPRLDDRPLLAVRAARRYPALLALRECPHAHSVYPFGDALHYVDARTDAVAPAIARELQAFLVSRGFEDATAEPTPPTVEDSFIARMAAPEGTRAA